MNQDNMPLPTTVMPQEISYAIGYVPYQIDPKTYSADEALEKGTLYPELYKPFTGKRGVLK